MAEEGREEESWRWRGIAILKVGPVAAVVYEIPTSTQFLRGIEGTVDQSRALLLASP